MNDPNDHDTIDAIIASLTASIDNKQITVENQYEIIEANSAALDLLDLVFYVTIGIMMFLCFFSL